MTNFENLEGDEWFEGFDSFMEAHPDCPQAKPISCLNLIMKKEWAEKILSGEKKVEFRAFSEHYCERLYDKDVMDYIDAHEDDDEIISEVGNYISALRRVEKIHFHNYNNTWFLDVSVEGNELLSVNEDDVAFLQEEFGCHDLDDELKIVKTTKMENPPSYFYFVIGEVLDTNLPKAK